jgi:hypothetical protein
MQLSEPTTSCKGKYTLWTKTENGSHQECAKIEKLKFYFPSMKLKYVEKNWTFISSFVKTNALQCVFQKIGTSFIGILNGEVYAQIFESF